MKIWNYQDFKGTKDQMLVVFRYGVEMITEDEATDGG